MHLIVSFLIQSARVQNPNDNKKCPICYSHSSSAAAQATLLGFIFYLIYLAYLNGKLSKLFLICISEWFWIHFVVILLMFLKDLYKFYLFCDIHIQQLLKTSIRIKHLPHNFPSLFDLGVTIIAMKTSMITSTLNAAKLQIAMRPVARGTCCQPVPASLSSTVLRLHCSACADWKEVVLICILGVNGTIKINRLENK